VGILNTNATTMIAASPGYEVISLDAAGDAVRPPVIAWAPVITYAFDRGGILPVALGVVFNADEHVSACPMGACSPVAFAGAKRTKCTSWPDIGPCCAIWTISHCKTSYLAAPFFGARRGICA